MRFDNGINHCTTDEFNILEGKTGNKTGNITPLLHRKSEGDILRKDGTRVFCIYSDIRMNDRAEEIVRHRESYYIQWLIATHEYNTTEDCRTDVVRMGCTAADEFLTFHCELYEFLRAERATESLVQGINCRRT